MATKDEVLKQLQENTNTDISGQNLADKLGVSRNAVWKAINTLKEEGYNIVAVTNRGYKLAPSSDTITELGIKNSIKELGFDVQKVLVYNTIDSTNTEAKRQAANGQCKTTLIVSHAQSAGKGRMGRSFHSPTGTGIYMSLLYKTKQNLSDVVGITTAAAVAVAKALEDVSKQEIQIKWVNDIYVNSRKVCGILTEAVLGLDGGDDNSIIIGVGINIDTINFPEELKTIASSLGKIDTTKNMLIAKITKNLLAYAQNPTNRDFMDYYRAHFMLMDKEVNAISVNQILSGKVVGVHDDGGILILPPDKTQPIKINSGEVSIKMQ